MGDSVYIAEKNIYICKVNMYFIKYLNLQANWKIRVYLFLYIDYNCEEYEVYNYYSGDLKNINNDLT